MLSLTAGTDPLVGPLGGGNATGRATRERLLLAAERLFADRGIAAVSLREVGVAAGQRNNGATQYHFGDRDGLVRAIVNYRAAEHRVERDALFDDICRPLTADDTRSVINAIVEPLAGSVRRGDHYVGFLARVLAEHGQINGERRHRSSGYDHATLLLRECLPDLPDPIFSMRLRMMGKLMIHALADSQRHSDDTLSFGDFVKDLTMQLTAVMRAPVA